MNATYTIAGMHCAGCVRKVEDALRSLAGVTAADVSLDDGVATIESDGEIDFSELQRVVQKAGDYQLQGPRTAAHGDVPRPSTFEANTSASPESLYPLFLIVGYIFGAVALIAYTTGDWSPAPMMRHFMAGFFIVFSFFKLLDLPGFVTAYRGYDLIAARSALWAYMYPFVELALGIAYLINFAPVPTNLATFVIMTIGAAGVLRALLDKRHIRCACLGTALNLPMTKVTLIEDLTMAVMAAGMLVMMWM